MLRRPSLLLSFSVALLSAACDDPVEQVVVAENLLPEAKIRAQSTAGVQELVRFDGTESVDQDGRIDRYAWTFGEGTTTASTAIAFHLYDAPGTYEVRLTVTDNRGESSTATHAVTIANLPSNQPPTAVITAPTVGDPGQPVLFDGRMSSDVDGSIDRYEWVLGVGGPAAQGPQVSHTFVMPGTYEITLAVTDDRGARSTTTHTIEIGSAPMNRAPVANAGMDRSVGVGAAVSFDGSMSFDADGSIATYDWNFGDGSMASGAMATHTYNVEATFRVTLTVTDDMGLTGTDTATITVGTQNYDGEYSMVANPSEGVCLGMRAVFAATTITFSSSGSMLTGTIPNPENPNGPAIVLTGSITGPSFSINGLFTDSQGGDHDITLVGTFSGTSYTATQTETISIVMVPLCTVMWNLSGDRL